MLIVNLLPAVVSSKIDDDTYPLQEESTCVFEVEDDGDGPTKDNDKGDFKINLFTLLKSLNFFYRVLSDLP